MNLEQCMDIVKGYTINVLARYGKRRVRVYINGFRAFEGTGEALACTLSASQMNSYNCEVRHESKECVYISLTDKTVEEMKFMYQVEKDIANFVEFYL